ncbi:MAG: hypothetical protein NTZ64_14050 [Polaromonas sp.]|nr:hypothetical protein [Polaromonas sp.]
MKKFPKGRTLAEFQPLQPAETALLQACAEGEVAVLGQERPAEKTEANAIRASFIRFLALGGDDEAPVHEQGVQLMGAWIEGELDLKGAVTASGLLLVFSNFESAPVFRWAEVAGTLNLFGSLVPGLWADGLQCKGGLFLSGGFSSTGEVRLPGIQIGGDLQCNGAKLDNKAGNALLADSAVIKGSVFLSDDFTATGEVRLVGAQIDGDLECEGAKLDVKEGIALLANKAVIKGDVNLTGSFISTGEVRLQGVWIDGSLSCKGAKLDGKSGVALGCDGMQVTDSFFFCSLASPVKGVSLASARVGQLIDDAASWGEELVLDGFVYDHLAGGAPTDAATRLAWIKKQSRKFIEKEDFRPQPWKQLQKVLHAMGHTEDARQVGIDFEDRLRALGRIGQTPADWQKWRRTAYSHVAKAFHFSFKWLIGYGYRPLRLGAWMVGVWLVCAFVYWSAALQGVMAPSNPLVFQHMPQYDSCKPNWYLCEALPEEYTGFSPLAYSLDVLLPLVNLQQEQDWAALIPTPKGSWYQELGNLSFKHLVRLVIWFEILFGWVASLLLVAVVSGLTKRSED